METIAKYTTKLSIEAKDTCIAGYECTRQCQMGIPVHEFALRQHLNNQNSAAKFNVVFVLKFVHWTSQILEKRALL